MRKYFILIALFFILAGMIIYISKPPADNKIGRVEFYKFDTNIELTLDDINKAFSRQTLNLKPQMEGEYPKLNGVGSKAFELIDGMVFIHIFENNGKLIEGKKQIKQAYDYEKWGLKVYEVNNMLFVYIPAHATNKLATEKHGEIIRAIEEIILVTKR